MPPCDPEGFMACCGSAADAIMVTDGFVVNAWKAVAEAQSEMSHRLFKCQCGEDCRCAR